MATIIVADALRKQVEKTSGGRVTVIYDDGDLPSLMCVIPKFSLDEVGYASTDTHPAFIVDGKEKSEILVGQFQASVVNGSAVSLPGRDPHVNVDFDEAVGYCRAKGAGWHLMTNAEWGALLLKSKEDGLWPHGNNEYGSAVEDASEEGLESYSTGGQTGRVYSGSGPVTWSHDHTPLGIWDLNGNVWEWQGGMRLSRGEIQVLPDNDAAADGADLSAGSAAWQAILEDGSLAAPGTADTLQYRSIDGAIEVGTTATSNGKTKGGFEGTSEETGVSIPDRLKVLGLFPDGGSYRGDRLYINDGDERLPMRGGYWRDGTGAGLAALRLFHLRFSSTAYIGFRVAYVI